MPPAPLQRRRASSRRSILRGARTRRLLDCLVRDNVNTMNDALLLRPETPVSYQTVTIQTTDRCIMVAIRDREDRFRSVLRTLGYAWDRPSRQWFKQTNQFTGTLDDRLVELVTTLLRSGYIVALPRPDLIERVSAADYLPEHRRWIKKQLATGWFLIVWPRAEDYYTRAMRISGSRYDGGGVVIVPPESYNEILDFAEMYDFRISTGARELANEAQQRFESMIMIVPAKRAAVPIAAGAAPAIDPELLDDVDDDDNAA